MSSERESTIRMRRAGKICARCDRSLPGPHSPGEKLCATCQGPDVHRVYMKFVLEKTWRCCFLEPDLKTQLPRRLSFQNAEKIRAIVDRVGNFADLQDRQALDYALQTGRGGVWLRLTEEQYRKIRRGR